MQIGENVLSVAFQKHHQGYLRNMHLFLNKMYHDTLYGNDESLALNDLRLCRFKKIEMEWIKFEKSQCLRQYDCNVEINNCSVIESVLKKHAAFNHPLFQYLSEEARLDEMKKFILNESVLNLEFFDYLALSIIGTSAEAKAKIITNLWDEAGRSDVERFHTTLFKKLLIELNLQYQRDDIIAAMSWEGLAGINLFSYLAIYPYNKTKYFGLLAATELLDPLHYHQLNKGLIRLFPRKNINRSYYVEHESLDVEHGAGWLNRVIFPQLSLQPEKTQDFWLGFYLRLDSVKKYYDQLLSMFILKQAA